MTGHPAVVLLALVASLPARPPTPGVGPGPRFPPGARVDTVATGLANPWAMALAPDGRLFFTERIGRIRIVERGRLRTEPWAILPVAGKGIGLLGLALAPDFARSRAVYVAGAFGVPGRPDSVVENRVYRLIDSAGQAAGNVALVLDHLPSRGPHSGGAVGFGPDRMLYVTTGDTFDPDIAQDLGRLGGKVLRLRPDGTIPPDNPVPGSPVYARGVRNPQGLAWDPETRTLFATDHGPSDWPWEGGRRDHDEINAIEAGANYGWPVVAGLARRPGYRDPLIDWTPAIAPSGLAFYDGRYRPWRRSLLVGALRGQALRRLAIARSRAGGGWRVVRQEVVVDSGAVGRIRAVTIGPDGAIYFSTSDRKTAAGTPDDRIYRIRLPGSPVAPNGAGPGAARRSGGSW